MKNLIIINALVLTFISSNANAGFFGASNYEECINDGKVGRSVAEMSALSAKCYSQFPKLHKLSLKKDVDLICRDSNEKAIYAFKIKGSKVKLDKKPNTVFIKTSHDKSQMTFIGDGNDKDSKQAVKIYGSISPIYGSGDIKVEYVDGSKSDFVYNFTCYENK